MAAPTNHTDKRRNHQYYSREGTARQWRYHPSNAEVSVPGRNAIPCARLRVRSERPRKRTAKRATIRRFLLAHTWQRGKKEKCVKTGGREDKTASVNLWPVTYRVALISSAMAVLHSASPAMLRDQA